MSASLPPAPSVPSVPRHSIDISAGPVVRRPGDAAPSAFGGGRYQVIRFLGEGAKKVVYLVHDMNLDRDVAFALLKAEALDPDSLARLRREAQAMGRLGDHPNIITIHDIGDENGRPYIVSQYMPGGSVAEHMARRGGEPMSIDDAVAIAAQLCDALAHAHSRQIVHRDLKPGNVWLADDGTAKLGDFGLAVASDRTRMTVEGLMVGTVSYMPPEQATGRGTDARSDLYSLGAMLYEMVTGRPPFTGDDTVAIISQHLNTPPISAAWHNNKIPGSLDSLITQMLAKAPTERPASAQAVRERLRHVQMHASEAAVAVAPAAGHSLSRVASGAFVGRESELASLKSAMDGALSGQGSPIVVVGEQGIGKTRLVEEAAVYASLRGATVLRGRCHESDGTPPFWPWVQVIRAAIVDKEPAELLAEMGSGAGDIAQIVPEVRDKLPGLPSPPALEPEQTRFRLFDSITSFLKQRSLRAPLFIALDDLQWADKASLLLLQFIGHELAGTRITIVSTYRDADVSRQHPLTEVLSSLRRERLFDRISLGGLGLPEVMDLLAAFAQADLPPEGRLLAENLHRATDGNPFFIEEVLRHLLETGSLHHREGRWGTDLGDLEFGVGFAHGVRELIEQRLSRLSESCNHVLTDAAIIGQDFDMVLLERVSDHSAEAVLEAVDEAVHAGIVEESTGDLGAYRFARRVIRDTLYESLSATRRLRGHRKVAEALDDIYAGAPADHAGQLSYHWNLATKAGADAATAARYCQLAAEQARDRMAYEEAIRHYERTIEAQKGLSDVGSRCDVLLGLGDAQWRAGEVNAARHTCAAAAGLARELKDGDRLARAALNYGGGIGGYGFSDRSDPKLVRLLEEALDALDGTDSVLRVRLLSRLAVELYFSREEKRREELSAEAVAMAQRLGDDEAQLIAVYSRAQSLWGPDTLDERAAAVDSIIRIADRRDDKEMAFRGHVFRLANRAEIGDMRGFEDELASCERLAEELRQPIYQWQITTLRAIREMLLGNFDESERLSTAAFASGRGVFESLAAVVFGAQFYQLRFHQGRLDEIEESTAQFTNDYGGTAWGGALACLFGRGGKDDLARAELVRLGSENFRDLRRDGGWLLGLAVFSIACWYVGDAERARGLYDLMLPFADRSATILNAAVNLGNMHLYLGVTAATFGEVDKGIDHLAEALRRNDAMGLRPVVAPNRVYYAKALLKRGEPADKELAILQLNIAIEEAQRLGMRADLEEALAAKLQIQGLSSADVGASIQSVSLAVTRDKPNLVRHAAPDGTVTLVFSDIAGSTQMAQQLGDDRWVALLQHHNAIIRQSVLSYGGYEVKSEGDGFMLAFGSARRAVECCIAIQRALVGLRDDFPDSAIHVRMGAHAGEVVRQEDDFFGTHVNFASRIASSAQGGEILVSALVKALTDGSGAIRYGDERLLELKGFTGTQIAYAVEWDEASAHA